MNEFLRKFIMNTVLDMIEQKVSEWQVRQYALGWYSKELLTEEDLAVIEEKYTVKEETVTEEIVEDVENIEETVIETAVEVVE